jgi:hypothetical protein
MAGAFVLAYKRSQIPPETVNALLTIVFYYSKMKLQVFYCSRITAQRRAIMEIKLFDSELKVMDVLWKRVIPPPSRSQKL